MYYLNNFFIYSVFGYIFEISICTIFNQKIESGFLYGPYTPVYGIGILIILTIYNNLHYKKEYKKGIMLFVFSFIILTILEYIGGITIEYIFKSIYWNYNNLPLHIGKYISLEISFIWGIASILYIYLLKPISDKLALLLPKYITLFVLIIFIIDILITFINKQKIL